MKLLYNGEVIGTIETNHSLSLEDCFASLGIDINEEEGGDPRWDYELFSMDWSTKRNYSRESEWEKDKYFRFQAKLDKSLKCNFDGIVKSDFIKWCIENGIIEKYKSAQ